MKISAQDKAQPRPRAQVASSTDSAARNTSRLSPEKSVQAIIKSQAGSPTPRQPKSMTALSLPCTTSRFPEDRSPWIQTGGPSHAGAWRAASHAAVTAAVSSMPSRLAIAARVGASRLASGTPRKELRSGRRPARRIDPVQGGDESCQVRRCLAWIGEALKGRVLAFEPPIDGPIPGVALGRCPLREGDRDGKRQVRGKSRQPQVLLLGLLGGPVDAGQSHDHVLAEPIERVSVPAEGN